MLLQLSAPACRKWVCVYNICTGYVCLHHGHASVEALAPFKLARVHLHILASNFFVDDEWLLVLEEVWFDHLIENNI